MFQRLVLFFILSSCPFFLFSQSNGKINGKILDSVSNSPLEFATITIFSEKDSSILTGDVTNEKGVYNIEVPFGRYFAKCEYLGYQGKNIPAFSISKENKKIDLGTILLSANSNLLGEVEVLTEKGDVQIGLDRNVYQVGKDISSSGGTAADILANVPSVAVETDGKITLRGNDGVQILVDGKPSSLVGKGTAEDLKRLQSNLISRVEVITNPSAKYESEGTAGIINIVLKKERKIGVNGSVEGTLGYPDISNFSTNLNMRKNKVNLFTNLGIDYTKNNGGGRVYQELKEEPLRILDLNREHSLGGLSGNIRIGADFFIDEKNIITTAVRYQRGEDNDRVTNEYFDFLGSTSNPQGIVVREDSTQKINDDLEYSLTYSRTFEKKGHELVADIRYQDNRGEEKGDLTERYFDSNFNPIITDELLQRSGNNEKETRWISKLDYTLPIDKSGTLELGYQGSVRIIENDFLVEQFNDIQWVEIPAVSNDFKYDEKIYGIYGVFKNKKEKFSYRLGARLEYTDVVTELLETNTTNPRDYFNFFPSIQLGYNLGKGNSISLSYNRRIRRPTFNNLNPFFTFNDPRNLFQGNPDLNPEFADSYEFKHVKYWDKGSLSSSLFYRDRRDVIVRLLERIGGDTTLLRNENINFQKDLGLDIVASFLPMKWWKLSANASFFQTNVDGTNQNQEYKNENFTWRGRLISKTTIKKKTDLQVVFNYRAPRAIAQGRSLSIAYVDIGLSRQLWNKKGKLSLNVSDLFNSQVSMGEKDTPTIFRETEFRWRYRTVRISLSYRF